MANLPEGATYDVGVYQLETTDPVQGGAAGISNTQAKQLTNRTGYLKAKTDAHDTAVSAMIAQSLGKGSDTLNLGLGQTSYTATLVKATHLGHVISVNYFDDDVIDYCVVNLPITGMGVNDAGAKIRIVADKIFLGNRTLGPISVYTGVFSVIIRNPGDFVDCVWSGTAWVIPYNMHRERVGMVSPFAGLNLPDGFLACNGAAISRSAYGRLFTTIGTLYGVGDGSTTFNLPDLRGEFIRGWDNGRGIDTGRAMASSQASTKINPLVQVNAGTETIIITNADAIEVTGTFDASNSTGVTNVLGGLISVRPRNVALLYVIKY